MPDLNDISFIIQGKLDPDLYTDIAQNIRKLFPGSEIILSTYKQTNIDNLDYDKVSLIDDPGFFPSSNESNAKVNNINRQIATTLAGLKLASRKYAFKLRSDFIVTDNSFLKFYKKFQLSDSKYKVFDKKLLTLVFFTRNSQKNQQPFLFHPSDMALFGLRSDLLNLFDIPLMQNQDVFYYSDKKYKFNRYIPEQYLWIKCLQKNEKKVNFDHQKDITDKNIIESDRYLVSNFICLDYEQFCLQPPEKFLSLAYADYYDIITHKEWEDLYKRYIDHTHRISLSKDKLRISLNKSFFIKKLCKKTAKYICFFIPISAKRKVFRKKIELFFLKKLKLKIN